MVFVSGYAERVRIAETFGFRPEQFPLSFAETAASGSAAVIVALMLFAGLAIIAVGIGHQFGNLAGKIPPLRRRVDGVSLQTLDQVIRWQGQLLVAGACVFFLTLGWGAGEWRGDATAKAAISKISRGCTDGCYSYILDDRKIVGVALAADVDRIAVYTSQGTEIVKSAKIVRILRHQPKAS